MKKTELTSATYGHTWD